MTLSRLLRKVVLVALLLMVALPVLLVAAMRFVHPPATPHMIGRGLAGAPLHYQWLPFDRMSPAIVRAVVAAEDTRFMEHKGFDWTEVEQAWRAHRGGRRLRGASTISMQVARTVFLWPERSVIRKGAEAYLTVLVEALWPKRRILETYLNLVEWGDGIYGCEAAAQHYFGKSCAALSAEEAARLAAILPNPRLWSPKRSGGYVHRRTRVILRRMPLVAVPEMEQRLRQRRSG
jgi:monofunctional biosynthetic peptidoglycan transglycosylase